MAASSGTALLELAQTISNAALTITKAQLQEQPSPSTLHPPANEGINGHAKEGQEAPNGANGVKKSALSPPPLAKEVQDAKGALIQAAIDLRALALGPLNYLTNLAFSVRCGHAIPYSCLRH